MTWYANVNDLIGGWIIANVDLPMAEIDCRSPERGGTMPEARVIAECYSEADAKRIAHLLNSADQRVQAWLRDPE